MEKLIHFQNAKLSYRAEGKGALVILLHGIPFDRSLWDRQLDFLKDHCRLIIPDLPGSGSSVFEKEEPQASTVEYYADCIRALLENEGAEDCILIGHSFGGYITLAFAEKYPAKLRGFGLTNSSAFADSDEKKVFRQNAIALVQEKGSFEFLKSFLPPLFAEKFKQEHPEMIEAVLEKAKDFPPATVVKYFQALMQRPDRTMVLKNSKVPVLFVMGTEDVGAPMKDVLQQVHLPPTSYIHILENCGHVGMWEATEKMNEALLQFVEACE